MKCLITSSLALLLLLTAAPLRADGPVSNIMGGIRGTVVDANKTHLVEWSNTTLHKLKFSYTLTLDNGTTITGTDTLATKQNSRIPPPPKNFTTSPASRSATSKSWIDPPALNPSRPFQRTRSRATPRHF